MEEREWINQSSEEKAIVTLLSLILASSDRENYADPDGKKMSGQKSPHFLLED